MTFVNPIGKGLKSARVDMGVDYTGHGSLYAMGGGVITSVRNAGWPGGTFIGLKLDSGQYMYYAENILPHVSIGQRVQAGQLIGTAVGTPPYIEVGWAAPPGTGQTMAAQAGQSNKGQAQGDPGKYPTGYGVAMSNLIKSLGGPGGIVSGPIQGGVPSNVPTGAGLTSANLAGSPLGCTQFVAYLLVGYYAIRNTPKCGWNIPRRQQRHRRRKDEIRYKERG
jgi:hypothetical protein